MPHNLLIQNTIFKRFSMNIVPLSKITLTEQIMTQIAGKIVSGELKPGEKLPNERQLASSFEVTRNIIREALRALSLIGMIHIKPSGGVFVCERKEAIPTDAVLWMYHQELNSYDDIYAARKLIETEVYLSCFRCLTADVLEQIKIYNNKIQQAAADNIEPSSFLELLSDLDLYIGANCGRGIYTKLMQIIVILRKDLSYNILKNDKLSMKHAAIFRRKILEAFISRNEDKVKKSLKKFFEKSINDLHLHNHKKQ